MASYNVPAGLMKGAPRVKPGRVPPAGPPPAPTGSYRTATNAGTLATRPMQIGAPAPPGTPAGAPRQKVKEYQSVYDGIYAAEAKMNDGPQQDSPGWANRLGIAPLPAFQPPAGMDTARMVAAAQQGFGGAARPNPNGAAANGGAAVRPQQTRNDGPTNTGGQRSYNVPWAAGDHSAAARTAQQMMGAQNYAVGSMMNQVNSPQMRVSGPLASVTGSAAGSMQNPGLYAAAYNNSSKAQQTIGAMGDPGDARWRANMGPNDTYTDQGQIIRGNGGGAAAGGGNGGAAPAGGAAGGGGAANNAGGAAGGGAGANSGTGNDRVDQIANWYQQAYDDAKAANLERYGEAKGMRTDLRERALADLNGSGAQEAKDIRQRYKNVDAQGEQDLIARGLGNSTRRGVMKRGVAREETNDMGRLNERLRQQRIGLDTGLTDEVADLIERRDDTYPDIGQLLDLMRGFGQSGFGQPGYQPQGGMNFPPINWPGGLPPFQMPQLPYWMPPMQGGEGNDFFVGGPNFAGGRPQPPVNQQLQPPPGFAGGGGAAAPAVPTNVYTGPNAGYWNGTGGGGFQLDPGLLDAMYGAGQQPSYPSWQPDYYQPPQAPAVAAPSYGGEGGGNYSGSNADYWNGAYNAGGSLLESLFA